MLPNLTKRSLDITQLIPSQYHKPIIYNQLYDICIFNLTISSRSNLQIRVWQVIILLLLIRSSTSDGGLKTYMTDNFSRILPNTAWLVPNNMGRFGKKLIKDRWRYPLHLSGNCFTLFSDVIKLGRHTACRGELGIEIF